MSVDAVVMMLPPPRAGRRDVVRAALGHGRTRVGVVLAGLVLAIALLGPFFAPHDPGAIVARPYAPAGPGMPLGADYLGEDVLSRVLWGGSRVVWTSLVATLLAVLLGGTLGLVAGYARNRLDTLLLWAMDVVMAFPLLVLVLLFVSLLGRSPWLTVLLVGLGWTPVVGRLARAVTLETVGNEFIESAEMMGFSRRRILFRELLPNVVTPLLVQAGALLTWSIGIMAGLSFLGLGVQPPNADWGLMTNENFAGLTIQPWAVAAPIACIAVFTVGINLIAEGFARAISGVRERD